MLMMGHYGNWEIGGCVMARLGYKIHSVVLEHEDRRINDFFRTRRHGAGQKMIPLGKAGKLCPKVFARNEILAILGDRIFGGKGVGIDFFGKPARFPRGAAVFGIRYECPIIPIFIFRSGRERYTVEFMDSLVPKDGLSFKDSVADMTQQYADVFRSIILRDPTQWYMFKDVWE